MTSAGQETLPAESNQDIFVDQHKGRIDPSKVRYG